MKFLVTGHGRSGTTFLARALNTSPTWTVRHEALKPKGRSQNPRKMENPARDLLNSGVVMNHFLSRRAENYGEVNSYLRYHADSAAVDTKAVIIRCPFEIALSCHNRGSWPWFARCARECFEAVDKLVESVNFTVIRFDEMTTDLDSLEAVARSLGVHDSKLDNDLLMKKVNSSKGGATTLPRRRREFIEEAAGWFKEKWNL